MADLERHAPWESAVSKAGRALELIACGNKRDCIFISTAPDGALNAARASDERRAAGRLLSPLDGMPVAIKDNIDVAGMVTTCGANHDFGGQAARDATVVARLRAAGAVILGKLNLHEGALGATTDNPFWGRCVNPAFPGMTPGGSSGGSAAAVAAGITSVSLGTDTMGSVRIPAAYCGVWALKPTRGLVSSSGLYRLSWTLDTIGPLAASAAELAFVINIIAGHDPADPLSILPPAGWIATIDRSLRLDEIAIGIVEPSDLTACEPAVIEAYERLVGRLRRGRAKLSTMAIKAWNPSEARRGGLLVSEAECGSLIGHTIDAFPERFSEGFRAMIAYGRAAPAERVVRAYWLFHQIRAGLLAAQEHVDALLLPTTPQRSFAHGTLPPVNQADFTALANIAGVPAVAFPVPVAGGGLPASAQLIGHPFSEGRLLSIAQRLASST